ncbi:MAG TPA: hypothetical protein DCF91_03430 [Porphyromonadaceae bacterium]|nr:hypothetical protein [Porphyromonadaceae bacterium]
MNRFVRLLLFPEKTFRKGVEARQFSKKKIVYAASVNFIFPVLFLILGLFIHVRPELKQQIQDKFDTQLTEKVDDYGRFVTIPFLLTLDRFGIPSANNLIRRVGIFATTSVLSDMVVHRTKKATNVTRPNGEERSFPSQHTSQAFLAASVLHYEYVGSSTTVSALGYATAATVGFLRIARDRHWSSDVLVGAAIGMLVTNWTYLFIFGLIESFVMAIWRKLKPRKQHSESE